MIAIWVGMAILSMDPVIHGYPTRWVRVLRTFSTNGFRGWVPTNSQVRHGFGTCPMNTQWIPIWQAGPTWQWHMSCNIYWQLSIDLIVLCNCAYDVCKAECLYSLLCYVTFYRYCCCCHEHIVMAIVFIAPWIARCPTGMGMGSICDPWILSRVGNGRPRGYEHGFGSALPIQTRPIAIPICSNGSSWSCEWVSLLLIARWDWINWYSSGVWSWETFTLSPTW